MANRARTLAQSVCRVLLTRKRSPGSASSILAFLFMSAAAPLFGLRTNVGAPAGPPLPSAFTKLGTITLGTRARSGEPGGKTATSGSRRRTATGSAASSPDGGLKRARKMERAAQIGRPFFV
jgi:hypothetical protein